MNQKDLTYRYTLASFLVVATACAYQFFYNYQINKVVNQSIESSSLITKKYTEINRQLTLNNNELNNEIEHWTAMYESSKSTNQVLEQQIDVINNYWKNENLKLSDELFDLKNTPKQKK